MAVLALHGAAPATLRQALSWARAREGALLRVAVDGGLRAWRAIGRRCDLFVGDADSAAPPAGIESVLYAEDKPFSDLGGTLAELQRRRIRTVAVAGLTGGRLDHEWVNLHELAARAPAFAGFVAPGPRGWVAVTSRSVSIETKPGKPFSLLALCGRARVRLRGARWELDGEWVRPGSRGLSNVSGRSLRLEVERGVVSLVFPEP